MNDDNASPSPKLEPDAKGRGRFARRPWQIPWLGWKDVVWRVIKELDGDNVFDSAASVAFFGVLALFPALIATVTLYSILADPSAVVAMVHRFTVAMPWTVRTIVLDQLRQIQQGSAVGLRIGAVVSLLVALFSASGGVAALMRGVNKAYDEAETRGWLRTRLVALCFTLGVAAFFLFSVPSITLLPMLLERVGLETTTRQIIGVLRWPVMALSSMVGLGVLYRYAPNRTPPQWQWVTAGALLGTLVWTLASLGFGIYAENFGSYNKTYGTLGGAIALLLWMYFSALAILVGAELNSELEHQTQEDSTIGPALPMGQRGAAAADELGQARPKGQGGKGVKRIVRETLADLNRPARGKH